MFGVANLWEGLETWIHWAACGLMFVLVRNSDVDVRYLFGALFLIGLVTAGIGIAQYGFGFTAITQTAPPSAVFANKNMAAHVIIAIIPLASAAIMMTMAAVQIAGAIGFMAMGSYLYWLDCSAGMVALVVQIVLAGLVIRAKRCDLRWRHDYIYPALLGLVFVILLFAVVTRAKTVLEQRATTGHKEELKVGKISDPGSASVRIAIWLNTAAMIRTRPIAGWGLGQHKLHYPPFNATIFKDETFGAKHQLSRVHNDYLQLAAELGLVGFALFGWMVWAGVGCWFRVSGFGLKNSKLKTQTPELTRKPEAGVLAGAVGIGIAGIFVVAIFSFPFQQAQIPFLLAAMTGGLERLGDV